MTSFESTFVWLNKTYYDLEREIIIILDHFCSSSGLIIQYELSPSLCVSRLSFCYILQIVLLCNYGLMYPNLVKINIYFKISKTEKHQLNYLDNNKWDLVFDTDFSLYLKKVSVCTRMLVLIAKLAFVGYAYRPPVLYNLKSSDWE